MVRTNEISNRKLFKFDVIENDHLKNDLAYMIFTNLYKYIRYSSIVKKNFDPFKDIGNYIVKTVNHL